MLLRIAIVISLLLALVPLFPSGSAVARSVEFSCSAGRAFLARGRVVLVPLASEGEPERCHREGEELPTIPPRAAAAVITHKDNRYLDVDRTTAEWVAEGSDRRVAARLVPAERGRRPLHVVYQAIEPLPEGTRWRFRVWRVDRRFSDRSRRSWETPALLVQGVDEPAGTSTVPKIARAEHYPPGHSVVFHWATDRVTVGAPEGDPEPMTWEVKVKQRRRWSTPGLANGTRTGFTVSWGDDGAWASPRIALRRTESAWVEDRLNTHIAVRPWVLDESERPQWTILRLVHKHCNVEVLDSGERSLEDAKGRTSFVDYGYVCE